MDSESIDTVVRFLKPVFFTLQKDIQSIRGRLFQMEQKWDSLKTGVLHKKKEDPHYECPMCGHKHGA